MISKQEDSVAIVALAPYTEAFTMAVSRLTIRVGHYSLFPRPKPSYRITVSDLEIKDAPAQSR